MYPVNVLLRYGHSLPDEAVRTAFLEAVTAQESETRRGVATVMSGALHAALKDTPLEHLFDDLAQRWTDFTEPAEDICGVTRN